MENETTEPKQPPTQQVGHKRRVMYRPSITGCSDGGCIFQDNSKGMHTNGGCQCERELRRHPQGFKAIQTIHFLRDQLSKIGT
jgi:hypothetical protein